MKMKQKTKKISQYFSTFSFGFIAVLLSIAIVTYPDTAFNASLRGLRIWWEIVFPALLPFFIAAEILLAFGVVHFMGVLLEPLMRPLFNVPGVGAFVMAMGFASGYPMGAKLTTRLREQNLITRSEGERLVSFTSTSDPLFLFGAIAVGFFHNVKLGAFLAIVHYLSSIIVGFIMSFHERKRESEFKKIAQKENGNIIIRAFKAMYNAKISDNRKLGKILGDAVMSSMYTLSMIGGFIMFFSVVLALISEANFNIILANIFGAVLNLIGISKELGGSLVFGLFEVTNGAKAVSETVGNIPIVYKLAVVSAISAWGGISVQAQIAAILQKTDIRFSPFLFARIIHSMIAFLIALYAWQPFVNSKTVESLPTFMTNVPANTSIISYSSSFIYLGQHFLWVTFILSIFSFVIYVLKKKYYSY